MASNKHSGEERVDTEVIPNPAEDVVGNQAGKSRESVGRPLGAKIDANHPLYKELTLIGRREKTLRPDRLIAYENLLNTPNVERRAGPGATTEERASAASEALKAAIADIVEPRTRLVTEAALCALEQFEGLTVQNRMTLLEVSERRITRDIYWSERHQGFGSIIESLTSDRPRPSIVSPPPSQVSIGSVSLDIPTDHDPDFFDGPTQRAISALVSNAARCYYGLFAYQFASLLSVSTGRLNPQLSLCIEYAFHAYIQFSYSDYTPFAFYGSGKSIAELQAAHAALYFPFFGRGRQPRALNAVATAIHCDPFAPVNRPTLEYQARQPNFSIHSAADAKALYYGRWLPWFNSQLGKDGPRPDGIAILADKATYVAHGFAQVVAPEDMVAIHTEAVQLVSEVVRATLGFSPSDVDLGTLNLGVLRFVKSLG